MSSFNELDDLTSEESKEKARKAKDNQRADKASLVQAYARLFKTDDGLRVLNDLSKRYLYDNAIDMNLENINYRAAFANGEAEVIKEIINKMQKAEVI